MSLSPRLKKLSQYKAVIVSNFSNVTLAGNEVQLVQKLIYIISKSVRQVHRIPQKQTALKRPIYEIFIVLND